MILNRYMNLYGFLVLFLDKYKATISESDMNTLQKFINEMGEDIEKIHSDSSAVMNLINNHMLEKSKNERRDEVFLNGLESLRDKLKVPNEIKSLEEFINHISEDDTLFHIRIKNYQERVLSRVNGLVQHYNISFYWMVNGFKYLKITRTSYKHGVKNISDSDVEEYNGIVTSYEHLISILETHKLFKLQSKINYEAINLGLLKVLKQVPISNPNENIYIKTEFGIVPNNPSSNSPEGILSNMGLMSIRKFKESSDKKYRSDLIDAFAKDLKNNQQIISDVKSWLDFISK